MSFVYEIPAKFSKARQIYRGLTPPWFQAILTFIALTFLMGAWVHSAFQGHWWGPFLPGWEFGVPEIVKSQYELFATSHTGWDGQFYFYQAQDLLALGDTAQHIDNPPYRYQRIGSPLLARLVSWILGQKYVPAIVYHLTQIGIVSIGYGFLVYWLRKCGHSSFWALAWLCCDGVLNALAFGMPDPVGDALFIIIAVGLLTNRIWIYLPAALFLPLVREAYALVCGLIALASLFGWIGWGAKLGASPIGQLCNRSGPNFTRSNIIGQINLLNTSQRSLPRDLQGFFLRLLHGKYETSWSSVLYVSLPCAIVIGWQLYVTNRFGLSPSKAGGLMIDYPFVGWWKGLKMVIDRHQSTEVVLHFFAFTLIITSVLALWDQRLKNPFAILCLPYIALLSCMSWVAWEDYSGYMKALGTVIVMLLLFLPKRPHLIHYALLIALIVEGSVIGFNRKKHILFEPYIPPTVAAQSLDPMGPAHTKAIAELKAKVEVLNEQEIVDHARSNYHGIWERFHRDLGPEISVRITNTSSLDWEPLPRTGMYAVNLSYQWLDAETKKVVLETTRVPLKKRVPPGESQELQMRVAFPQSGKYILKIAMLQEGIAWFSDQSEQYSTPVIIQ